MKVEKVLNNNLVKAYDQNGREVLVMGCGLGFKKKPGDPIDETKMEKIYRLSSPSGTGLLEQLLERIPLEHLQLTNEVIRYAKTALGKELNEKIYLTLSDHMDYAIERAKEGLHVRNALLWEIQRFYPQEFLVAKEALSLVRRRIGVELPEDEAGFIALHLVNASLDLAGMSQTAQMTQTIQTILNIVRYHFQTTIDEHSLHYERFITHLKFFVQRVFQDAELDEEDKSFLLALKEKYPNEYRCALKIREYMFKEYQRELTEDELIYLTVHIKRVTTA